MRIKNLLMFLAADLLLFSLLHFNIAWSKAESVNIIPEPQSVLHTAPRMPTIITLDEQKKTPDFDHVVFAAKTEDKSYKYMEPAKRDEIIDFLQNIIPEEHLSSLENLILDYNPEAHRGLGGKSIIILRAVNIDLSEFYSVMVHEIGHTVDLGYFTETDDSEVSGFKDGKKNVFETDPSLGFYRISWKNDTELNKTASNLDFVSGYAMTDPFEDFAESYVYYVLHNKDFKSKTQTSPALLAKYEFMKNEIFQNREFDTGEYLINDLKKRPWDITVLDYDLEILKNT